jgi:DNA gyrase/topoisomerase IV subunit A
MTAGDVDPELERWAIRQRLNLMEAMANALDRMDEVNTVVRASADRPAAVRALCDAPFGFTEQGANHVLDLTVARQTEAGRQGLQSEIEQARKQLADPE